MANSYVSGTRVSAPKVFTDSLRDSLVGEFAKLKEAFTVSFWEPDSRDETLRVLERAADDPGFIAQLTYEGSDALQDYHLSQQAKAALLSGDIQWIEKHVGKLDARLSIWPRCRLEQEIW